MGLTSVGVDFWPLIGLYRRTASRCQKIDFFRFFQNIRNLGGFRPPSHVPTFCCEPGGTSFNPAGPPEVSHLAHGGYSLRTVISMVIRGLGCRPKVKMAEKSIFSLWSGIILGWSEWRKNAYKWSESAVFGSIDVPSGHPGCPHRTRAGHQNRSMALNPSLMGHTRASKNGLT